MPEIYDHAGEPVRHGRARVNGIRMHYVTAGEGPALLLLHGTPKTHFYWYKLIPRLTEHFTVVAPDLRGFGDTDKPPASEGYDARTNADDVAELMTQLGHEQFHLHGEDRGAEFAYVLAATQRDRVLTMCFAEMLLSGQGLEEWSNFTPSNISAQFELRGTWVWHIPFFWIPDLPEMLITGREREFWEHWIKAETYNPMAIADEAIDEWISKLKAPGGLRGCLETYRAGLANARINAELIKDRLTLPIATIGAPEFFGDLVEGQMLEVAERVERAEVFQECGHSLALEADERLAALLREFMLADGPERSDGRGRRPPEPSHHEHLGRATEILPWLSVADATQAISFYRAALGAQVGEVAELDGVVEVAELSVGDVSFWVQRDVELPVEATPSTTARAVIVVPDPARALAMAVGAGATTIAEVHDQGGWETCRVADPFGHHWEFARRT